MKIEGRRGTAGCGRYRRGSEDEEVRKHRDRVKGAWKQHSKQRRRVDISYDPSMVMALRHGTRMDEERFTKICIKEKGKKECTHQPFLINSMAQE